MITEIDKRSVAREREFLKQLLAKQERRIKRQYIRYINRVNDFATINRLRRLVESQDFNEFFQVIDSLVVDFSNSIVDAFNDSGKQIVPLIEEQVRYTNVSISFDPSNPRAQRLVSETKSSLIRQISRETREIIDTKIANSMLTGDGPRTVARDIRQALNLTDKQNQAVDNYRRLLEQNDREALQRELRDRRSDRSIIRALEKDQPLDQKQIDSMVARYRLNYINHRAEVIARTQATTALNMANDEAFRQAIDLAGISASDVQRTWQFTRDDRTRDHHENMRDKTVTGLDTPFIDGLGNVLRYPGDPLAPANSRIQCRCVVTNRIIRKL